MTATVSRYRSGHCAVGNCGRCAGAYGHVDRIAHCRCACHDPAKAQAAEEAAVIDHDVEVALREHVLHQCVTAAINETATEGLDPDELATNLIAMIRQHDKENQPCPTS